MSKSINHTPPLPLKSTEALQNLMEDILRKAKEKGASDAEVAVEQDRGFSVDTRLKEVETVSFCDDQSLAITVYVGKQKGSASTTELKTQGIDQIIDAALSIARVSAADECFGLADRTLLTNKHPDLDLMHPWPIEPKQAIELASDCEQTALASSALIVNSDGANVSSYMGSYAYANTHGAEGVFYTSRHTMSCSLVAEKDKKLQRDYAYSTARDATKLLSPGEIATLAAERTLKRLGARKIKTQRAPVLFESRIASHLIGTFIQAISGGALYRKHSFLLDSIGKSIFPDFFHIQEFPYLKGALGSCPFDDEGVSTRENTFVDQGRVQQYVLSNYTARRLALETSANAGGVHNLTVKPNAGKLEELIKQMDTGLLVTELMGDGVNIQNGDYSKGAFGYWVEKGKIIHPVEEITIAGSLPEMYQKIVAVGEDWDLNRAARCGSILIESMTIAGT